MSPWSWLQSLPRLPTVYKTTTTPCSPGPGSIWKLQSFLAVSLKPRLGDGGLYLVALPKQSNIYQVLILRFWGRYYINKGFLLNCWKSLTLTDASVSFSFPRSATMGKRAGAVGFFLLQWQTFRLYYQAKERTKPIMNGLHDTKFKTENLSGLLGWRVRPQTF